jgi:hypothetical protein
MPVMQKATAREATPHGGSVSKFGLFQGYQFVWSKLAGFCRVGETRAQFGTEVAATTAGAPLAAHFKEVRFE